MYLLGARTLRIERGSKDYGSLGAPEANVGRWVRSQLKLLT